VAAAASLWFLFSYGHQLVRLTEAQGAFHVRLLDEVSVWLYRERDAAGQPASPYRLAPYLSIVDPLDGPNWEVRIPGWIPALGALGVLGLGAWTLPGERGRDVA
jgi:hypothetical protein